MIIKGKLTQKLKKETGTSKAGKEWQKQEIVIDTGTQYNPEIAITFFGEEKIKLLRELKQHDDVEVSINISSREHDGKWYHSIDGWKIENTASKPEPAVANAPVEDDDLPF